MENMKKFCRMVEEELEKIVERGLNRENLETAYKLIDMYKDLKNTEYWDTKSEYYMAVLDEMQSGEYSQAGGYDQRGRRGGYSRDDGGDMYSERRGQRRDSRGRYSRAGEGASYCDGSSYADKNNDSYARYMDSKRSYRSSKSGECKQRMMQTLDEYMDEFTSQMEEMLKDADCAEERETIKHYIDKVKRIA